jgi:hypothetical protein
MEITSHDGPSQPLEPNELRQFKQSVLEDSPNMLDFEHKRNRGNSDNEPGKRPVKSPQDFQKKSGIYSKGFFN